MGWNPGDVPFVQTPGQWSGTDFSFNANAIITPPGQQYQIVTTLPTPVASLEGFLFFVLGTPGVGSQLWVLRRQPNGTLSYTQLNGSTVRLKMGSAGTTPLNGGLDPQSISVVPWLPGTLPGVLTPVSWNVTDVFTRIETPGSTQTTLTIKRSIGTGVFTSVNNINDTPVTVAGNAYEPTVRPPVINHPLVNSGDKLGALFSVGNGAVSFSTYVTLTAV